MNRGKIFFFFFLTFISMTTLATQADDPLEAAVRSGDLEKIKELNAQGLNHFSVREGKIRPTFIQLALKIKRLDIVDYLVQKGADVNQCTWENSFWGSGYSDCPIHTAVRLGYMEAVEYLVKKGAHIDKRSIDERTLTMAAQENQWAIFQYLLSRGASFDQETIKFLVIHNKFELYLELKKKMAPADFLDKIKTTFLFSVNADQYTRTYWNMLHLATLFGREQFMRSLFEDGVTADPLKLTYYTEGYRPATEPNLTLLHLAAFSEKIYLKPHLQAEVDLSTIDKSSAIEMLLARGETLTSVTASLKYTPLFFGAKNKNFQVLKLLAKSDPNHLDFAGCNVFNHLNSDPQFYQFLMDQGFSLHAGKCNVSSDLAARAKYKSEIKDRENALEVFRYLYQKKLIDLTQKGLIHDMVFLGQSDLVEDALKLGVSINQNDQGSSPLGVALEACLHLGQSSDSGTGQKCLPELIAKLIKLGADVNFRQYDKRPLIFKAGAFLELLVQNGADINALNYSYDFPRDSEWKRPWPQYGLVHLATYKADLAELKRLKSLGADLAIKTSTQKNAFLFFDTTRTIDSITYELVQFLLASGVDPAQEESTASFPNPKNALLGFLGCIPKSKITQDEAHHFLKIQELLLPFRKRPADFNVCERQLDKHSLTQMALTFGRDDLAQRFFAAGDPVNYQGKSYFDGNYETTVGTVFRLAKWDLLEQMMKKGAKITVNNTVNSGDYGANSIVETLKKDILYLQKLIEFGWNPNSELPYFSSIPTLTLLGEHYAEMVLQGGADPNGNFPLDEMLSHDKYFSGIGPLLKYGAKTRSGASAFFHSCQAYEKDNFKIFQFLLSLNPDLNELYQGAQFPLHLTIDRCNVEKAKALLEHGADPRPGQIFDFPYYGKMTLIEYALKRGCGPIADLLR